MHPLGLGSIPGIDRHIRGYRNGKDLTNRPREVRLIDLFGLSEAEAMSQFPSLYQHVLVHVKPERDQNNRDTYRLNWWTFGEPRRDFRPALVGLPRYIATVETSKHRFFTFLDQEILPDNMLIAIASDDAFLLGVLSSSLHVTWALASGGTLEDRPRYNKTTCFEPFPFPALEDGPLKQRIRDLGERLDAHRKRQQAQHPGLTLTGMYNVLEKLRAGEALSAKDRETHDQGLISLLPQQQGGTGGSPVSSSMAHGQAARAPLAATEAIAQQLLTRLVALNHQRATSSPPTPRQTPSPSAPASPAKAPNAPSRSRGFWRPSRGWDMGD